MPQAWLAHGMARTRISTTVAASLLADARRSAPGTSDSKLIDDALAALLERHRRSEIDRAYASAYSDTPIGEPDESGDLDSFRAAS